MCAGPGGKASLISRLLPSEARLVASDVHPHRAGLVRGSVAPATATVVADGTRPPWRSGSFDRVLLDVPCSGLGALRRRPEVRWRRTPQDIDGLVRLQNALLDSALDAVRVGGLVVYATCSPHLAETREVVRAGLERHRDVEQIDARGALRRCAGARRPVPTYSSGRTVRAPMRCTSRCCGAVTRINQQGGGGTRT